MTGSVALDVVIGLVFVYLLYSLLATIILEMVATGLGLRARNLFTAIDRMLTDQTDWPKQVGLGKFLTRVFVTNKMVSLFWETLGDTLSFLWNRGGIYTKQFFESPE